MMLSAPQPFVLFPGSFNPMHEGHVLLARPAEELRQQPSTSRLFPGTTFVIGPDTAERLVAPKYYGDDEVRMDVALQEIANSGSSFLVAVRTAAAGRVRALSDILVPRRYADLFTKIPEHRFRFDTSSSEIRARDVQLVIHSEPYR